MRRIACVVLLAGLVLWPVASARPYSLQFTNSSASVQLKWPSGAITVAFSTSLNSPPPNIKAGSDVVGAARRALARWAEAANVSFVETTSGEQLVGNDGVNLITVGAGNTFTSTEQPGRARLSFNTTTGAISDADVAINPSLFAVGGGPGFSTDGTPGTYDLESTFVHEIGHLLGLEHSGVLGATMQPRQGRNGLYDLSALTMRTLSYDDRAGVRSIYGPTAGTGAIAGTVSYPNGSPAFGAHVWAEEVSTGRVMSGNIALADGRYRIEGLPPGQYRVVVEYLNEPVSVSEIASRNGGYAGLITTSTIPFATTEAAVSIAVAANAATALNITTSAAQPFVNPSLIGTNNQLSTINVPLVPGGGAATVLVGGDNVHQIAAGGVSVNSPFVSVDPASVTQLAFGQTQVLGFRVSAAITAPPGEYSLRFTSGTGEVAYISGGLVIDLPNGTGSFNPLSDDRFLVAQQYRDFLNREPEQGGFDGWLAKLAQCPASELDNRNYSQDCTRIDVSASFFRSTEFQLKGYYVYRFHRVSYGARPRYADFTADSRRVTGATDAEFEANRAAFPAEWVQRPEFRSRYDSLSNAAFVDTLLANAGVTLPQRDALVGDLQSGAKTRAQVLREIVESAEVYQKFYNEAFVAMEYFGYLRRDPDQAGFDGWLQYLNRTNDYRTMVWGFLYSPEYRLRFGPVPGF